MSRPVRQMGWALVAALLACWPVPAEAGVSRAPAMEVSRSAEERWEWTREELAAARPLPLPELSGAAFRGRAPAVDRRAAPLLVPGSAPAGVDERGEEEAQPSLLPLGYDYPPPFTRYRAFNIAYRKLPQRAVGKLFFRQYGIPYVCSAAVVGEDAIWTAGHCAHAGDGSPQGWSTNVVFIPAYREGNAPYGQWRAKSVRASTAWVELGDFRFDLGGMVLRRKDGRSIKETVGSLGFAANLDVNQHWTDLGYPAAGTFDGQRQQVCTASYAYNDLTFPGEPYPVGIGCDQTAGSSGGPWLTRYRRGNYVNGHNSYRYAGKGLELFSPYYGPEAVELFSDLTGDPP